MSLIIYPWNGRLGNNVLQIIRAIHFGKINRYNIIIFGKHAGFLDNKIVINNFKSNNNKPTIQNTFFYPKKLNFEDAEPYMMKQYFQHYIAPIFFVKSCINTIDNQLHIHIRGGDTFSTIQANYVPPPLSYYTKIIDEKNWNKINIVHEDTLNPCVNLLKEKYPDINFYSNTLQKDISILAQCQNLVVGFGTFGLLIYFLSKNIKNLYIPDYVYKEMPKGNWGINVNIIKLPNYIKCGEWRPDKKNMDIIVNYS